MSTYCMFLGVERALARCAGLSAAQVDAFVHRFVHEWGIDRQRAQYAVLQVGLRSVTIAVTIADSANTQVRHSSSFDQREHQHTRPLLNHVRGAVLQGLGARGDGVLAAWVVEQLVLTA